ncbi:MAG: putative glycosyltransferase [Chthonomonadales bacterium]|nr:putative glycosyltransferase [Chthonomonadales bacterium]
MSFAPPKRIAYLTESFTMGGAERSTTLLIRHLDRTQYDPILICSELPGIEPMVEEVKALGVPVIRTPLLASGRSYVTLFPLLGFFWLFKQHQPDILHIQVLGGTGGRLAALAGWLTGIPVIIKTVRGAARERLSWPVRRGLRLLDSGVTCYTTASESNRQLQIENVGRRPEKVKTIYNAIDLSPYLLEMDAEEARLHLSLPKEGPIIGTIARLDPQKGIEYFLEMAQQVHTHIPNAHFFIVGEGEYRAYYEDIARSQEMQSYVTFAGYRSDIARCLAAMDVFVLASRFEPFGLVLAEAMASQRPIVATQVGGIPEVLEDGVSGTLVPPEDGNALANAVLCYLAQPQLASRHAQAAQARVKQYFSIERLMFDMEALYADTYAAAKKRFSAARKIAGKLFSKRA